VTRHNYPQPIRRITHARHMRAGVSDGFDRVPWASLTHAYGAAADVPNLLRRIAAGDEDASR